SIGVGYARLLNGQLNHSAGGTAPNLNDCGESKLLLVCAHESHGSGDLVLRHRPHKISIKIEWLFLLRRCRRGTLRRPFACRGFTDSFPGARFFAHPISLTICTGLSQAIPANLRTGPATATGRGLLVCQTD